MFLFDEARPTFKREEGIFFLRFDSLYVATCVQAPRI